MNTIYKEYRCQQCSKLLFKGLLVDSEVEIKCKRCHELTVFKGIAANELICLKNPCPHRVAFQPVS